MFTANIRKRGRKNPNTRNFAQYFCSQCNLYIVKWISPQRELVGWLAAAAELLFRWNLNCANVPLKRFTINRVSAQLYFIHYFRWSWMHFSLSLPSHTLKHRSKCISARRFENCCATNKCVGCTNKLLLLFFYRLVVEFVFFALSPLCSFAKLWNRYWGVGGWEEERERKTLCV